MRKFLAAAIFVTFATFGNPGSAQDNQYPRSPIRIIVPFAPGGSPDIVARLLTQYVGEGRQFVVENVTGAGGNIGMQAGARAAPDGYTVLMCTVGCASNQFLMEKMGWDPHRDIVPVMMAGVVPNVLVVGPTITSNSVRDFVELAKAKPGSLTMASSGIGSASHLAGEMFKAMAGVEIVHIPYRGSTAALPDIMGGRVDSMIVSLPEALSLIRSGAIRALGVSSERRVDSLPDVPTLSEAGVPGYAVVAWSALFAPAATPPAAIEWLNREFNKALKEPAVQARFAELSIQAGGGGEYQPKIGVCNDQDHDIKRSTRMRKLRPNRQGHARRGAAGAARERGLCASSEAANAGKADDTLNVGFGLQLQNLDALYSPGREGLLLYFWLYDTILYRDPVTFEFKPLLATAWQQVDDRTIDLTIRQGVKFHDGTVIRPTDDAVYTLNFVANKANNVFNNSIFDWIDRAEKLPDGKVRLYAKAPTPTTLEFLAKIPIYPQKYYERSARKGWAPTRSAPVRSAASADRNTRSC